MLVAEVAVGQVVALRDIGTIFGGIELGDPSGDSGADDGGLEFHGVVTEEREHGVKACAKSAYATEER